MPSNPAPRCLARAAWAWARQVSSHPESVAGRTGRCTWPPSTGTAATLIQWLSASALEAARSARLCDSFDLSMFIAPSTAHSSAETSLRLYTFALITSCHSRGSAFSWKYRSAAHQLRRTAYCSRVSALETVSRGYPNPGRCSSDCLRGSHRCAT